MTLELLVCTIDLGIHNVKHLLLAPIEGVSYLVSWQHSHDFIAHSVPPELQRDDVKIITLKGRGLSRNRNNAIRHASADICLIADDDCTYRSEYFAQIIDVFSKNTSLHLATFMMKHSADGKQYPAHSFSLSHYAKGYYATSFEIAFRREFVQGRIWFNENFGLGAPVLQSGEENLFIKDATDAGLHCRFFPIVVVEHNHPTTSSSRISQPGVIMAEGAYISIAYPLSCLPRLLLKAFRLNKANRLGYFKNLSLLCQGISHIRSKNRI